MNCTAIRRELDAYRTREIDSGLAGRLEWHLEGCAPCRAELSEVENLARLFRDLPVPRRPDAARSGATQPVRVRQRRAPAGDGDPIEFGTVPSPIGPLQAGYRDGRIVFVSLTDTGETAIADRIAARLGRPARHVDPAPEWVGQAIAEAFAGRRARYLPIDLSDLSPFDRAVLEKAREIPPGEIRTYTWIAREIGHPGAVRAVGTALGHNPIPFLVPCHRVVRSDLSLGGYAFGLDLKQRLLRAEGLPPEQLAEWAARGRRFEGSRSTRTFCFPCCQAGDPIPPENLVAFRSAQAALDAGFRPCPVCRPAPIETAAS